MVGSSNRSPINNNSAHTFCPNFTKTNQTTMELGHKDPQMLFWTTNTQTVFVSNHRVGDVENSSSMSVPRCLSCGYSSLLLPISFPFSLCGGKWLLLLLPVSCMRSCHNGQETRFVTGGGRRFHPTTSPLVNKSLSLAYFTRINSLIFNTFFI